MNKIKQLIELFESAEKVIKEKTFNIKNKTYNTPKGDVVLEEKSYTLKLLKNDAGSYTITINDKVLVHANKLELKNLTNEDAMKYFKLYIAYFTSALNDLNPLFQIADSIILIKSNIIDGKLIKK